MSKMNQATLAHILTPIISALCFVTIITINPTTVTGDLGTKEITATTAAVPATATTSVPTPPAPAANATESKQQPSPTTQPQPSRSTNTTTAPTTTTKPSPSTSTTSQSTKASAIIATSKQYIGVNYVYGGTTPSGFDCSGFVQYVFAKNGITLPRVSRDQYKVGSAVSYNNLSQGDLVFFSIAKNGVVDHEGIYIGNGQFINAASSKGVAIYTFGSYWQSVYLGARRVI